MTGPAPQVAVVVLNWNNAPDTLTCLASLREHDPDTYVVVVDNGSSDDSLELIRACDLADEIVANSANLGYTGGNNAGLTRALATGAAHVAVLNNDTTLHSALFSTLAAGLDASSAVSPVIVYADDPGQVWFAGGVLDRGMPRHLQRAELPADISGRTDTDLLTGCCILAAREVWQRVGLFDARYFLYFEDSDWSMRARAAGVVLRVDGTQVLHHGVSRSFQGPASMLATFYYARNGIFFHRRYARALTATFIRERVLRPALRGLLRRGTRLPSWPLGPVGAMFGLTGRGGPAPGWVQRWSVAAIRRQRRRTAPAPGK